jgi:hypothetical protein
VCVKRVCVGGEGVGALVMTVRKEEERRKELGSSRSNKWDI